MAFGLYVCGHKHNFYVIHFLPFTYSVYFLFYWLASCKPNLTAKPFLPNWPCLPEVYHGMGDVLTLAVEEVLDWLGNFSVTAAEWRKFWRKTFLWLIILTNTFPRILSSKAGSGYFHACVRSSALHCKRQWQNSGAKHGFFQHKARIFPT